MYTQHSFIAPGKYHITTPIGLGLSWPLTKKSPPFGSGDRHLLSPWRYRSQSRSLDPNLLDEEEEQSKTVDSCCWEKNLQNFLGGELHVDLFKA